MSIFKKSVREKMHQSQREKLTNFALYQITSSGQRAATGDRGEMVTNAMNNNQRLATLRLLRQLKDD